MASDRSEHFFEMPLTGEAHAGGSSWRSIALASLLTVGLNAVIPYTQFKVHTISLVEGMIPMGVLMPFLVLVFLVNPLLRALGMGLRPYELIVVFSVSYVSAHINEFLGRVLATFAIMHYMATPENLWAEYAFDVVRPWLVVEDAGERLDWFYEGLPAGASIPWGIWIRPLFWWLSFIAAVGVGCVALATLLRRQWVEQERLPFPFARVAEDLAETAGPGGFPAYMRGGLFWAGFAVPAFVVLWYIIGYFRPGFPVITVGIENYNLQIGRHVPPFYARINFLIIAFAYFTDLQVLFSIWFFFLVTWTQIGVTARLGLAEGLGDFAGTREQAVGGFIVFCVWAIWTARKRLGAAFRKALSPETGPDDANELLSCRAAGISFLAAAGYMIFWLAQGGMNPLLSVLMVVFWFLFYAGFAKIAAMTGLVFVESPALGTSVVGLAPPGTLSGGSIAVHQLVGSTYQNGKCFAMPAAACAARLAAPLGRRARVVGMAIVFTFVFSLVAAAVSTIYIGYQDGAFNFGAYDFRVAAPRYFDTIVSQIRDMGKETHYGLRMAYTAFGAAAVGLLTFCSYRFTWWPFHPVGFTLVTFYSARTAILSVFVTWLVKTVILKVGSISLYRRAAPFFIGMIVGYTFGLTVSMAVDLIWFPGQGHSIFWGD